MYTFSYNKQDYYVEWEEENRVLKLLFFTLSGTLLKEQNINLLGVIDQTQLDQLVKDYWNSFKNNFLKDC